MSNNMKKSNITKLNNKNNYPSTAVLMKQAKELAVKIDKQLLGYNLEVVANTQLMLLTHLLAHLPKDNLAIFIDTLKSTVDRFAIITPVPTITHTWYLFDDGSIVHEDDFNFDENQEVIFQAFEVPIECDSEELALKWIESKK